MLLTPFATKNFNKYMHVNIITDYSHYTESFSGMDSIKVTSGPMGTSVDGLALWMKTVLMK